MTYSDRTTACLISHWLEYTNVLGKRLNWHPILFPSLTNGTLSKTWSLWGAPFFFPLLDTVLWKVYSLLSIEAKKSRSAGRQPKEPAPEETNESVFAVFLREAGVTLKQGGTSNEIGKHTQCNFQKKHTRPVNGISFSTSDFSDLYLFPSSCWPSSFPKTVTATTTEESQVPWGKYIYHPWTKTRHLLWDDYISLTFNFLDCTGIHQWTGGSYWGPWAL